MNKLIKLRTGRVSEFLSFLFKKILFSMISSISCLVIFFFLMDYFLGNINGFGKFTNVPLETFLFFVICFFINIFRELGNTSAISFFKKIPPVIEIKLIGLIFPILGKTKIGDRNMSYSNKFDLRATSGKIYFHLIITLLMILFFYLLMKDSGLLFTLITTSILNLVLSLNPFFTITAGYKIYSDYYKVDDLKTESNTIVKSFFTFKPINKPTYLFLYSALKTLVIFLLTGLLSYYFIYTLEFIPDLINLVQELGLTPFNILRICLFTLPYFVTYLFLFKGRILI